MRQYITRMTRGRYALWLGLVTLVVAVNLGANFALLGDFDAHPSYFEQGERLLVTPDGYYFLRQAEDWSQGRYTIGDPMRPGLRPQPVPPLSAVTAVAAQVTGQPLQRVAFFIPPFLGLLTALAVVLFGAAAGPPRLALAAGLLTAVCEAWISRSALGIFDTDCLIPGLFFMLLYALYRMDEGSLNWGASVLPLGLILYLWWPQAGLPMFGFALGVYALSGLFFPGRLRRVKLGALCAGLIVIAAAWFGLGNDIPGPVGTFLVALNSHLRLAFNEQSTSFLQTGWTIEELAGISPTRALELLGGHWAVGAASLAGLLGLAWSNKRLALYLVVPSLALLGASLYAGQRFVMFAVAAYALGLGWLCMCGLPRLAGRRRALGLGAGTVVLVAALVFGFVTIRQARGLAATFEQGEVALARTVNEVASPSAGIWNWWGPGYMLEHFAKRETFFDGGLQGPTQSFISAVPLASRNPGMARNWIKFFSVHPDGFDRIRLHTGDADAVRFLQAVFTQPAKVDEMVEAFGLDPERDWYSFLFPDREVYLVLLADMLVRNTWLAIGSWDPVAREMPETPLYSFLRSQVRFDRGKGALIAGPDKVVLYSKLLFIKPDSLTYDQVRDHGPVAILVDGIELAYVVPEYYFQALAFQLLYVHPDTVPGFEKVVFNPFVGGVWRVR